MGNLVNMDSFDKCLFCDKDFYADKTILYENKFWIIILDSFPCSKGHSLIIPKHHISSFFKIGIEVFSLFTAFKELKKILDERYSPSGYNIGVNDGNDSGQTIPHLHIHVIPRYKDDGGLPCGVRNVFPPHIANYIREE